MPVVDMSRTLCPSNGSPSFSRPPRPRFDKRPTPPSEPRIYVLLLRSSGTRAVRVGRLSNLRRITTCTSVRGRGVVPRLESVGSRGCATSLGVRRGLPALIGTSVLRTPYSPVKRVASRLSRRYDDRFGNVEMDMDENHLASRVTCPRAQTRGRSRFDMGPNG